MGANDVTDELVQRVLDDLRERYALDDDAVRALGVRLADDPEPRQAENLAFADEFTTEHRQTFDRLAR